MANTYQWDIQSMACYPTYQSQTNVVFTVNTLITATSDTDPPARSLVGISTAVTHNPDDPFVAYEELTPDVVIAWVKAAIGDDGVANIQANLDAQIQNILTPPVVNPPLPWVAQ
jgi:hypothetical protein